jgi:hypothetical protein
MSDYKDFRVIVTYEGGISISAIDEADAEEIARDIMLEETNPEMAKYLTYTVERITE